MHDKDTTKIGYFKAPVSNCYPSGTKNINAIYDILISDELIKQTKELRSIVDVVLQRKYKAKNFPYVTFSGVFCYRDEDYLIYRSQYFCVDLDHLDSQIGEIYDAILKAFRPVLMFISPSGNGLKVVLLIDPNVPHELYFAAFRKFFKEHFNVAIDEQCKDIPRACFLCHDPLPYVPDGDPTLFDRSFVDSMIEFPAPEPLPEVEPEQPKQKHPGKTPKDYDYQSRDPRIIARYMIRKAEKGQKHGELLKAAHLLGGLVGADLITRDEARKILRQELEKRKKDIISMEDAYKTIEDGITDGMNHKMYDAVLTGDEPQNEPAPSPTNDQPTKTPLFPVDAFPKPYADIIRKASELYGTHIDYWSVSFLAAMSGAIGRRYMVKTEKYSNSAALWFGIVGPTGSGKTAPSSIILKELKIFDKESYKIYFQEKMDYEAIMDLPKKERGEKPQKPPIVPFQVIVTDFSPESLSDSHSVNEWGLLLYRDELLGWINDLGRYNKSGEVENMLSIWGGEGTVINRKSGITRIDNPCVSIIGGIQPERLKLLAADGRSSNGLMQRFCFAFPDKVERPDYINDTTQKGLFDPINKVIRDTVHISPYNPTYFNLTSDSLALYQSFYNRDASLINSETSDYVRGIHAKMDIIVLRLALIICTLNEHTDIDVQDIEAAVRMTEYFRSTAMKVNQFLEHDQVNTLDKKLVIKYLHNKIKVSQSEIGRLLGDTQPYINKVVNGL